MLISTKKPPNLSSKVADSSILLLAKTAKYAKKAHFFFSSAKKEKGEGVELTPTEAAIEY